MWPSRSSKSTIPLLHPQPPPQKDVNTHDTDPQPNKSPTDTTTSDPTPPDSPVDTDLDNTEPCETFTFDDSTLEHLMDAYPPLTLLKNLYS